MPGTPLKWARDAAGHRASWGLSCSPPAEAMQRFLLLVYAGLTGSVTMISCTVLALTRLFFEFKGEQEGWGLGAARGDEAGPSSKGGCWEEAGCG